MKAFRCEKGQAWTMALIILAISALVVAPAMTLTSAGLIGQRRHESQGLDRYTADSGVEHALWRVQYESGFAGSLSLTPTTYTKTFNARANSIGVALAPTPTPAPVVCPPRSGGQLCMTSEVSPAVITANVFTTFYYTLSILNTGTSTVHIDAVGDLLPASFTYVAGSAASTGIEFKQGASLGEPSITVVDGQQRLYWNFATPKPSVRAGGIGVVTFEATATPSEGSYYNDAWVEGDPTAIGEVTATGPSSPVVAVWPEYDITSQAGGTTIKARAKRPDTGIIIRSWQVQ